MNIAITGANGYIGRALCGYLQKSENNIIVTITRSEYAQPGCQNLKLNNTCSDLTTHLANFDCLIHLASRVHHADENTADLIAVYRRDNVELSTALAKMAIEANVKRFIYISSIKVNGEESSSPFRSRDPVNPVDPYGVSKHEAEQSLKKTLNNTRTELTIIRPPLVWGGEPKGNLRTLAKLIDKGIPLPFKNINNKRDIVSIDNLCGLIAKTLTHPMAAGETFLVSDGIPRSTAQIIRLLEKNTARRAKLFSVPKILIKIMELVPGLKQKIKKLTGNLEIDISDTQKKLNWQPRADL